MPSELLADTKRAGELAEKCTSARLHAFRDILDESFARFALFQSACEEFGYNSLCEMYVFCSFIYPTSSTCARSPTLYPFSFGFNVDELSGSTSVGVQHKRLVRDFAHLVWEEGVTVSRLLTSICDGELSNDDRLRAVLDKYERHYAMMAGTQSSIITEVVQMLYQCVCTVTGSLGHNTILSDALLRVLESIDTNGYDISDRPRKSFSILHTMCSCGAFSDLVSVVERMNTWVCSGNRVSQEESVLHDSAFVICWFALIHGGIMHQGTENVASELAYFCSFNKDWSEFTTPTRLEQQLQRVSAELRTLSRICVLQHAWTNCTNITGMVLIDPELQDLLESKVVMRPFREAAKSWKHVGWWQESMRRFLSQRSQYNTPTVQSTLQEIHKIRLQGKALTTETRMVPRHLKPKPNAHAKSRR